MNDSYKSDLDRLFEAPETNRKRCWEKPEVLKARLDKELADIQAFAYKTLLIGSILITVVLIFIVRFGS